jgi:hypothetical protein
VSIPRHHIPADQWEFEYGPAENDPEFGNIDDGMGVDATEGVQEDNAVGSTGCYLSACTESLVIALGERTDGSALQ